jgi:hypothetical protein
MTNWSETFDAVFFISIATLFVGLLNTIIQKCYQSKCENFSICWNFINVRRRVDLEIQSEIRQMELDHEHATPTVPAA